MTTQRDPPIAADTDRSGELNRRERLISRRSALRSLGAGIAVGASADIREQLHLSESYGAAPKASTGPTNRAGEPPERFWLGDDNRLQRTSLKRICIPGTHHASFYRMTKNYARPLPDEEVEAWTRAQSRSVADQLADGVRYFDTRPVYDPENGHEFWEHHNFSRGPPLEEVFDDIVAFLREANTEAQGNEFAILKFSGYMDFGDEETWAAFTDFVASKLGDVALDLREHEPNEVLNRPLAAFDDSFLIVLYRGGDQRPPFAGGEREWLADGWQNEVELEALHNAALEDTHTDTSVFGRTGYYITPDEERIARGSLTRPLPDAVSEEVVGYNSLRDAAEKLAARYFQAYFRAVVFDDALNPNIIPADYYEYKPIGRAARQLSYFGLHTSVETLFSESIDEGPFEIASVASQQVVGVSDDDPTAVTVQESAAGDAADQAFTFERNEAGGYLIRNLDTGKLLQPNSARPQDPGADLILAAADDTRRQRWFAYPTQKRQLVLLNAESGLVADGGDAMDGTTLSQRFYAGRSTQRWQLRPW